MEIKSQFSLKPLNTFGIDAIARQYCAVTDEQELLNLLASDKLRNDRKFILGGGSNILFTQNLDALCIHNKIEGIEITREDTDYVQLKAGGGVVWHSLVTHAVENNWGGIENLSLIPGFAGAAPIQNIGAYGVELKETFSELEAIDLTSGEKKTFTHADCSFGYRDSIFKRQAKGRYIITSISLRLSKQPKFNTSYGAIEQELKQMGINELSVKAISQAVINIRRSKLPDPAVIGNAGSFFKNPTVVEQKYLELKQKHPDIVAYPTHGGMKLAAGWLIEQSGWKGKRVGNVGMHDKQALVLVNYGQATGDELITHARNVQQSVLHKFDVELEMEVNIV